jgi:hypothetical protein
MHGVGRSVTPVGGSYFERTSAMFCNAPLTRRRPVVAMACLIVALLASSAAVRAEEAKASVWLSPGFLSHHFDRSAGYREDNIGFGAEVDLPRQTMVQAGSYINSDRLRTHYAGGAWSPIEFGPLRLGVYAGAFDGYPLMRNGGWFLAALPILSYRGDRLGVNFTAIPNYGNKLHGAFVGQILLRVW